MLRSLLLLAGVLILNVSATSATSTSTWSIQGHDAQDTSFSVGESVLSAADINKLHVVWTVPQIVSAIATDDRVYAILPTGAGPFKVVVMNAADGHVLLTYTPAMMHLSRAAGDTPTSLAHPDDTLVVGATREVVALNPHTGKLEWSAYGGATELTYAGSTIYTGKVCANACGAVATYALDLSNGHQIWRHRHAATEAPIAIAGALYADDPAAGGTEVYDPTNGVLRGSLTLSARWLGDGTHAYAFVLVGLQPKTKKVGRSWIGQIGPNGVAIWKSDLGTIESGNPVLAYGDLFVPSDRHHPGVIALNAKTGAYLWGANVGASTNMAAANRLLYILNGTTGRLTILRTTNGSLVRTMTIPGFTNKGETDLMVAGGQVYAVGAGGIVALGV